MKRVSMIAIKRMRYGSRTIKPGETFDARPEHARLYVAIKQAKRAPAPAEPVAVAAPAPPVYQTRAIQPESEPTLPPVEPVLPGTEDTAEASPRRRAVYRRRDMRVEE